eukprot:scaffold25320_cov122-Cylindrotheca_fusiformis.AAC.1
MKDPGEILELSPPMTAYCVTTWMVVAFAFGRSTPAFLTLLGLTDSSIPQILQVPGLILALASLGSGIVNATVFAPSLNRDSFVWAMKGACGGPIAVMELQGLGPLITRGEYEENQKK